MPTPPFTADEIRVVSDAYHAAVKAGFVPLYRQIPPGKISARQAISEQLGLSERQVRSRIAVAQRRGLVPFRSPGERWVPPDDWQQEQAAFDVRPLPPLDPSYEELKALRLSESRRMRTHFDASGVIQIDVKIPGPYGIMTMGDPHLDDDGTDWNLLNEHTQLIRETEGLFGGNVGDVTNNWVGRLARLYSGQNTSRRRALILAEGWIREVRWLWIDSGNHDAWSGDDDPIAWIARFAGVNYKRWQGSRLQLISPNGEFITVNSRHHHRGQSQYHPTHGLLKSAIWDTNQDDLYVSGHIHCGALHAHIHPDDRISWLIRHSSYKIRDGFADYHGFPRAHLPAAITVVNPYEPDQRERIQVFTNLQLGVKVLKQLRRDFLAEQANRRRGV